MGVGGVPKSQRLSRDLENVVGQCPVKGFQHVALADMSVKRPDGCSVYL